MTRLPARIRWASLIAALTGAACADQSTGPGGPVSTSLTLAAERQIGAAVAGRMERGVEDEILRMEASVPGLGGLFVDASGKVVVLVPAASSHASTRSVLARIEAGLRLSDHVRGALRTGEGLELRNADYPFSQLVAWEE